MKPLELEKNGFGLKVYCRKCKRNFTHKNLNNCSHADKQSYKSMVYKDGKAKVKHHNTRVYSEALKMAIDFKSKIKSNSHFENEIQEVSQGSVLSVKDSMNLFLNFQHDLGVYEHQIKGLSKGYLSSQVLYLSQFVEALENAGYILDSLPIDKLNASHVDIWHKYVKNRYDSQSSINAIIRVMRLWIKHLITRENVKMQNPFLDVKLKTVRTNVDIITEEEFYGVLDAVSNADPYVVVGKDNVRKNRFRTYLKDFYLLALYTGLRREEVATLTFADIKYSATKDEFVIVVDNLKVERITKQMYKPKFVPVHDDLFKLLKRLGWDEFEGTDTYVIEPYRQVGCQTIMDAASKGFSHFFKQAFPDRPYKQLKVLRKTYLTYLCMSMGEEMIHLSSHGSMEVIENHYLDKKMVAKGKDIKIFGQSK